MFGRLSCAIMQRVAEQIVYMQYLTLSYGYFASFETCDYSRSSIHRTFGTSEKGPIRLYLGLG